MKRRNFLLFSSILGLSPYIQAEKLSTFEEEFKTIERTLFAVQAHMFPKDSKLPSADSMNLTQFVFDTITHKSYDRDIKVFVLEGAKELHKREKGKLISMSHNERENALRAYEQSNYGSNWLNRILTLTMEGLFSDPIYGANNKEAGWQALESYGGFPRPHTKYLGL
ncbi:MAG: gluconate 2-dehydrogenase subunit 3 family protein [Campylobacterota bacterium]|nr:gluconate 2-dehydrogenase subunit 3 family protein [Campylobacterota bacterium]